MRSGKVQKLVASYLEKVEAAACQVNETFDEDAIHKLRVNVKRLRALMRLYWLFRGKAKPGIPAIVRKLYKCAGRIRDLQLVLQRFGADGLPQVYLRSAEAGLEAAKADWATLYDSPKLTKAVRRLSEHSYKPLPAFIAGEFFKNRMEEIELLSSAEMPDDEELHSIRKLVKDIVYMQRIADEGWSRARLLLAHVPILKLEELADVIGEFNDMVVARQILAGVVVKRAGKANTELKKKLEQHYANSIVDQRPVVLAAIRELS